MINITLNRLLSVWMLALMPTAMLAQDARLSIEDFTIKSGEQKDMVIDLTNPDEEITLVQFDLQLPVGLSLKMEGGDYVCDIAGRTDWRNHSLSTHYTEGAIRFLLASNNNATLSGTCGPIIKMTLTASNSFQEGSFIRLEDILLVTPGEKEIKQQVIVYYPNGRKGDVNGDGAINVADIATIIDVMAGKGDEVTEKAADVNGDDAVNVADIATVISRMAELARLQHTIVEK